MLQILPEIYEYLSEILSYMYRLLSKVPVILVRF